MDYHFLLLRGLQNESPVSNLHFLPSVIRADQQWVTLPSILLNNVGSFSSDQQSFSTKVMLIPQRIRLANLCEIWIRYFWKLRTQLDKYFLKNYYFGLNPNLNTAGVTQILQIKKGRIMCSMDYSTTALYLSRQECSDVTSQDLWTAAQLWARMHGRGFLGAC